MNKMAIKVLVPVKRVIDANVRVRLDANGKVAAANLKMSMNPFDEAAVEEAVRLIEQGIAAEAVIVSIGPAEAAETARTALAMGASRGILIETPERIEPLAVAKILKIVCEAERPDLVLCGRQAIDDDAAQMGPMLAGLMGWAQATAVSQLSIDGGTALARCETEQGSETLRLKLPAVVSTDLRLNQPRYVTLPGIIKAKKKPLETIALASLGGDFTPRLEVVSLREAEMRRTGIKTEDVRGFFDALRATGAI
jgi:electron transfer flavoprotein beta subunit